jgi:hypothetical protein
MGEDTLRDMCDVRHISGERIRMGKKDVIWFPYTESTYTWAKRVMRALFSGGSVLRRISELL